MKVIMIVAALLGLAMGEAPSGYPSSGYGLPNFGSSSTIGGGSTGGQTYRHVYVHSAPDDPEDQQARVIRIPGRGDKHVNIIFVKTPSQSASQQTEVILPEQDQQKTLVYVLHRKFDASTDLKIRAPRPAAPSKPQVYFIRYGAQQAGGTSGGSSSSGTTESRPVYGTPNY